MINAKYIKKSRMTKGGAESLISEMQQRGYKCIEFDDSNWLLCGYCMTFEYVGDKEQHDEEYQTFKLTKNICKALIPEIKYFIELCQYEKQKTKAAIYGNELLNSLMSILDDDDVDIHMEDLANLSHLLNIIKTERSTYYKKNIKLEQIRVQIGNTLDDENKKGVIKNKYQK